MMISSVFSSYPGDEDRTLTNAPEIETLLSLKCSKPPAPKPCKRVRFSDDNVVVGTVPNKSQEEKRARWFGKPEYAELIWESSVTLTFWKSDHKKHLIDNRLLCARGLIDREHLKTRQEERAYISKLVLFQLRVNKESFDDEAVAKLYHECSMPTVRRALDEAHQDELEAKRYQNEESSDDGPSPDRKGHCTQAENRAAIEDLVINQLEDCEARGDITLTKCLNRLLKRRRENQARRELKDIVIMQRLQEFADIYNHGNLSPVEKATVERAVERLLQEAEDPHPSCRKRQLDPPRNSDLDSRQKMMKFQEHHARETSPDPTGLIARADNETLLQEVRLFQMQNQGAVPDKVAPMSANFSSAYEDPHDLVNKVQAEAAVQELLLYQLGMEQSKRQRRM